MSNLTQEIINRLHRIEQLSEPRLAVILEIVRDIEIELEQENPTETEAKLSCFELTSHLIGIGDDLPEDLSTNPEHMAGYGL